MQQVSVTDRFKDIQLHLGQYAVMMLTLPWLIITSIWILLTVITFFLQTDSLIRLTDTIVGDFGKLFTYFGSWALVTLVIIGFSASYYSLYKQNKVFGVLVITTLVFLCLAYLILLLPEIDLFLKYRR